MGWHLVHRGVDKDTLDLIELGGGDSRLDWTRRSLEYSTYVQYVYCTYCVSSRISAIASP